MHLLLLGLFLSIFLHDVTFVSHVERADRSLRVVEALPSDAWPGLSPLLVAGIVIAPKLLFVALYALACHRARRTMGATQGQRWLKRIDRISGMIPLTLLLLFTSDLAFGGLRTIRLALRHIVLVDEFIIMLPTLLALGATWWLYYPIDKQMRSANLIRRADSGLPLYPPWSRAQYLAAQFRHQVALLFVPLLIIAAWSESITLLGPDHRQLLTGTQATILAPLGVIGVFLVSPMIIRYVWDTTPLPEGEIRSRMLALCKTHKVGVRQLLLWRTYGGMVNAAVMGLVAPLRYILLTDALLEQVDQRSVEAVMAHEIAHVRKHHMVWMLMVLLGALGLSELCATALLTLAINFVNSSGPIMLAGINLDSVLGDANAQLLIIAVPSFIAALLAFGWVSRRIERQADVFAARHMVTSSMVAAESENSELPCFDAHAIQAMVDALKYVAILNHVPIRRKSWRHGSIHWRQQYLRSLVGTRIDQAPVDRVLTWVKIATLIAIAALISDYAWHWFTPAVTAAEPTAILSQPH